MKKHYSPKPFVVGRAREPKAVQTARNFFLSLKKAFGGDTLEALHRVSWRHYAVAVLAPALLFTAAVPAHAADKPMTSAPSAAAQTKLVSREGQLVSAEKKAQAPKPGKRTPHVVLPTISKADAKAEGETKSLKGTVSGRSNYGIAVEYGQDPKLGTLEMWSDLMKQTELTGVKKFSDFQVGDTVEIVYKQLKDGSKRILKEVKLIRKAPKEAI